MSKHSNTPTKMGGGFSVPRTTSRPIDIPKPSEKEEPKSSSSPFHVGRPQKEDTGFFSTRLRLTDTPATFSSYQQVARRQESLRRLNEFEEKHLRTMSKYEDSYGKKYEERNTLPHSRVSTTRAGPLAKYAPRHNNGEEVKREPTEEKKPLSIKCSIKLKDTHEQFVNTFLKK